MEINQPKSRRRSIKWKKEEDKKNISHRLNNKCVQLVKRDHTSRSFPCQPSGAQNGQLVFIVSIQSSVLIINVRCNALASDDRDLWRSCSNVPRPRCLTIPRRRPRFISPNCLTPLDENLFREQRYVIPLDITMYLRQESFCRSPYTSNYGQQVSQCSNGV